MPNIDLVVGSVLIPGDKAPHLITRNMLQLMKPGTVLVDVAIDQGGLFREISLTLDVDSTHLLAEYSCLNFLFAGKWYFLQKKRYPHSQNKRGSKRGNFPMLPRQLQKNRQRISSFFAYASYSYINTEFTL